MGLSNYVPNSRLAQPGVCTSTTRPATPYEGQVIYETDTNRVLVWDASAWVMIADTDQPPGLQLIETRTVSSVSETNFDVFDSVFTNYKFVIRLTARSASTNIHLRFRSGTTTNADNDYYYAAYYTDSNGASNVRTGNPATFIELFTVPNFADFCTAEFTVHAPAVSGQRTTVQGTLTNNIGSGFSSQRLGGLKNVTTAWGGLNIYSSTGGTTFSGVIQVYGFRD